jgi:hypothetical protein
MKIKSFLIPLVLLAVCILASCASDKTGDEHSFMATILDIKGDSVLVEPIEGEDILRSSDKISFSKESLDDISAVVGDVVNIVNTGDIMASYPAQINAVSWTTDLPENVSS